MRKNTLLIATAVAALTAGSSFALAQNAPNPAAKNAPAEKMAPAAQPKPAGAAEHATPSGAQRSESAPMNKVGQGEMKRPETTGQAPSEPAQATPKQDRLNPNEQKGEKSEKNERGRTTTGQGAPENRTNTMEKSNSNAMEKSNATQNRAEPSGAQSGQAGGQTSVKSTAAVNLSTEQKTKIHSIIIADRGAPRVAHVDFQLNVGIVVPRTVRLAPVPETIVEIQPVWRGFEYFLVGDEIVVVDPASLEIVAVLPA